MNIGMSYYSSAGGREENEDSVYINEFKNGVTAIVADGLGGHDRGKTASDIAVKVISNGIMCERVTPEVIKKAFAEANTQIRAKQDGGNMCTTAAVLYIGSSRAYAAHIGDSRIYQFRGSDIIYQSLDHSVSQMAVLVGEIKQEEIRGHSDRNRLLKALGASTQTDPDVDELEVKEGDAFLVCSDGFWELILENEMQLCLEKSADAGEWLRSMRNCIDGRSTVKSDNNTAAVIIIEGN